MCWLSVSLCDTDLTARLTVLFLFLWTGSRTQKSRSWLQWAAGGCSSPTVVCLAPRRWHHPGRRRVSQTWVWASNLCGCLDGTDPGATRTRTFTPPPPRSRPAPHLVSIVSFSLVWQSKPWIWTFRLCNARMFCAFIHVALIFVTCH